MSANKQMVVLGGGCFWCLEASYQQVNGVVDVVSGYAGGTSKNPTYYDIHDHESGHAEVVEVTFDPAIISLEEILAIFWVIHDPTTLNRQGNDVGPEYRSIILYTNPAQKPVVEQSKQNIQKLYKNSIVTEIKPLEKFYEAEAEHQNFYNKHPEAAYCQVVINPKLQKLQKAFAEKLK